MRVNVSRFPFLLAALLLSCAGLLGASARAQEPSKAGARKWRVMVIIPETHLSRPRIPDPAAETAVNRLLIEAGYKVVDQGRVRQLRESTVVDRLVKGGASAKKEAMELGRKFGADVLLTGEAFSQLVSQRTQETEVGTVNMIQCRARVELKAYRTDTGEIVYADSIQLTGSPELTEELASKICLEQAADAMEDGILAKFDRLAYSPTVFVELEVRGIASAALAGQLETALGKLPGVQDVTAGDYVAHTSSYELTLSRASVKGLAARLEAAPSLKRFRMRVHSASPSKIVVNCK